MDRIEARKRLAELLKRSGRSLTAPRKAIFDALVQHEPQFMSDIVGSVGSAVDRASVYRTIALFEQLGVVKRLQMGWKYKLELSDAFSPHHHHLMCLNCGKVIPLREDTGFETSIKLLALKERFLPKEHQLEIQGICEDCQLKRLI